MTPLLHSVARQQVTPKKPHGGVSLLREDVSNRNVEPCDNINALQSHILI